jgi:hypothetical protein
VQHLPSPRSRRRHREDDGNRDRNDQDPSRKRRDEPAGQHRDRHHPGVEGKIRQTTLPATRPTGTPTTIPATATVAACQNTTAATWRRTNPRAFSRPLSRRRRHTLTVSR